MKIKLWKSEKIKINSEVKNGKRKEKKEGRYLSNVNQSAK